MKEPEAHWTVGTLKEYFESKLSARDRETSDLETRFSTIFAEKEKALNAALAAQKESTAAQLASAEKAVNVAEENSLRWRESANEWRSTLTDIVSTLVPRTEYNAFKETINKELHDERSRGDKGDGRQEGQAHFWGYIVGAAGVVAIIMEIIQRLK